jgi:apoptosis-inducing factor 3
LDHRVKGWDEIIVHGDIPSKKFIAYYVKNNHILAAVGDGYDREMAAIEELIRLKKMPAPKELQNPALDLTLLLK